MSYMVLESTYHPEDWIVKRTYGTYKRHTYPNLNCVHLAKTRYYGCRSAYNPYFCINVNVGLLLPDASVLKSPWWGEIISGNIFRIMKILNLVVLNQDPGVRRGGLRNCESFLWGWIYKAYLWRWANPNNHLATLFWWCLIWFSSRTTFSLSFFC